jgi:hypothetical protein
MFWSTDLWEKCVEVAVFPRFGLLFISASNLFLANLHSKFECPPITKNVFPEVTKNFCIVRFLTSIVKFGERARKLNQPFWRSRVWPWLGVLTKVFCAKLCKIMSSMFMSLLSMINHHNWGIYLKKTPEVLQSTPLKISSWDLGNKNEMKTFG